MVTCGRDRGVRRWLLCGGVAVSLASEIDPEENRGGEAATRVDGSGDRRFAVAVGLGGDAGRWQAGVDWAGGRVR